MNATGAGVSNASNPREIKGYAVRVLFGEECHIGLCSAMGTSGEDRAFVYTFYPTSSGDVPLTLPAWAGPHSVVGGAAFDQVQVLLTGSDGRLKTVTMQRLQDAIRAMKAAHDPALRSLLCAFKASWHVATGRHVEYVDRVTIEFAASNDQQLLDKLSQYGALVMSAPDSAGRVSERVSACLPDGSTENRIFGKTFDDSEKLTDKRTKLSLDWKCDKEGVQRNSIAKWLKDGTPDWFPRKAPSDVSNQGNWMEGLALCAIFKDEYHLALCPFSGTAGSHGGHVYTFDPAIISEPPLPLPAWAVKSTGVVMEDALLKNMKFLLRSSTGSVKMITMEQLRKVLLAKQPGTARSSMRASWHVVAADGSQKFSDVVTRVIITKQEDTDDKFLMHFGQDSLPTVQDTRFFKAMINAICFGSPSTTRYDRLFANLQTRALQCIESVIQITATKRNKLREEFSVWRKDSQIQFVDSTKKSTGEKTKARAERTTGNAAAPDAATGAATAAAEAVKRNLGNDFSRDPWRQSNNDYAARVAHAAAEAAKKAARQQKEKDEREMEALRSQMRGLANGLTTIRARRAELNRQMQQIQEELRKLDEKEAGVLAAVQQQQHKQNGDGSGAGPSRAQ